MILTIKCQVPDEWRDQYEEAGVLNHVQEDIKSAVEAVDEVQMIDIKASDTICGHKNWNNGHCAEMSCDNYVSKHMH